MRTGMQDGDQIFGIICELCHGWIRGASATCFAVSDGRKLKKIPALEWVVWGCTFGSFVPALVREDRLKRIFYSWEQHGIVIV
uniref:Uncharacterized protein n=1 Tax=Arundo donax TaxID=35708 RepID=A0A0A8YR65_ARUDO